MASMVYAGKIIKDLGLEGDYTLVVVGTVQEEDCDGLCWQYIIKESGMKPEFVVSTEPTDGGIYRGQRGRMEIKVEVRGISAHGSAPERGDNAIFKMGRILGELEELHGRLQSDAFLGKGSLTVSEIFFTSPVPLRRGRRLHHLHRPPAHGRGDGDAGPEADPGPARGQGRQVRKCPCTTTKDPLIPGWSILRTAISPPGCCRRTTW